MSGVISSLLDQFSCLALVFKLIGFRHTFKNSESIFQKFNIFGCGNFSDAVIVEIYCGQSLQYVFSFFSQERIKISFSKSTLITKLLIEIVRMVFCLYLSVTCEIIFFRFWVCLQTRWIGPSDSHFAFFNKIRQKTHLLNIFWFSARKKLFGGSKRQLAIIFKTMMYCFYCLLNRCFSIWGVGAKVISLSPCLPPPHSRKPIFSK